MVLPGTKLTKDEGDLSNSPGPPHPFGGGGPSGTSSLDGNVACIIQKLKGLGQVAFLSLGDEGTYLTHPLREVLHTRAMEEGPTGSRLSTGMCRVRHTRDGAKLLHYQATKYMPHANVGKAEHGRYQKERFGGKFQEAQFHELVRNSRNALRRTR